MRLLKPVFAAVLLAGGVHAIAVAQPYQQPYYAPPPPPPQPYYQPPVGPRGNYSQAAPRGPGFRCAAGPRNVVCDLADPPRPLGSPCTCEPPFPGRPPLPGQVIR